MKKGLTVSEKEQIMNFAERTGEFIVMDALYEVNRHGLSLEMVRRFLNKKVDDKTLHLKRDRYGRLTRLGIGRAYIYVFTKVRKPFVPPTHASMSSEKYD